MYLFEINLYQDKLSIPLKNNRDPPVPRRTIPRVVAVMKEQLFSSRYVSVEQKNIKHWIGKICLPVHSVPHVQRNPQYFYYCILLETNVCTLLHECRE